MNAIIKRFFSLLSLAFVVGCASNIQTDRPYQEIGRAQHFNLSHPGYIIGFEKRDIKVSDTKFLAGVNSENPYENRFRPPAEIDKFDTEQNNRYKEVTTSQTKIMLATQITKKFPNQEYIYNAYEKDLDGEYNFETSFAKINDMFFDVGEQLRTAENPYSHILVMSMGWNNDQVDSLWRYNKILNNLALVAKQNNETFRPLVIGFTWPSAWFTISDSWIKRKIGHIFSYGNKADDADEIGYTWANWIVNHKLPEAIEAAKLTKPPKTVIIGHSFGARLLSRAIFSSKFIDPKYKSYNSIDLFLGLQGAVSANRFVQKSSSEGAPYSDFAKLPTKLVFTTSSNDQANPFAYYLTRAAHIGGYRGLDVAKNNKDIFEVVTWNEQSPMSNLPSDKVIIVDASSIVKNGTKSEPSAHNDILDIEMSRLMWHFIRHIP